MEIKYKPALDIFTDRINADNVKLGRRLGQIGSEALTLKGCPRAGIKIMVKQLISLSQIRMHSTSSEAIANTPSRESLTQVMYLTYRGVARLRLACALPHIQLGASSWVNLCNIRTEYLVQISRSVAQASALAIPQPFPGLKPYRQLSEDL